MMKNVPVDHVGKAEARRPLFVTGGNDESREDQAVLTIYEKVGKSIFGDVVVNKGASELATCQLVEYLDSMVFPRVVFKTGGENPITALMRAAKVEWSGELVIEESPLGDSNSNGAAEAAVKVHRGALAVVGPMSFTTTQADVLKADAPNTEDKKIIMRSILETDSYEVSNPTKRREVGFLHGSGAKTLNQQPALLVYWISVAICEDLLARHPIRGAPSRELSPRS